jgi:hypothetical protein
MAELSKATWEAPDAPFRPKDHCHDKENFWAKTSASWLGKNRLTKASREDSGFFNLSPD